MSTSTPSPSYHDKTIDETFKALESQNSGLSEAEVGRRRQIFGYNEIITQNKRSRLKILLEQFNNIIVYVLLAAAVFSGVLGKFTNVIVIIVIIIVNGCIGFIQEIKAEKSLESLQNMAAPEATVLRDCGESQGCTQFRLKTQEIVPGDILFLEAGDKIPADARLFEIANLQIEEAILTGESLPVWKNTDPTPIDAPLGDRKDVVFSGTIVAAGRGKAVVYAIGMQTQMGKIAQLINQTEEAKSPLEKKVERLGKRLGIIALIASALTFLIGILRGFELLEMLLFASAVLVSSIPSGLPAIITITLAIGVSRMVKRNAIIRKLKAIDSLGAITSIVSDKTGTLTQNQMTVRKIYVDSQDIDVTGVGYTPTGKFLLNNVEVVPKDSSTLKTLLETAVLCNDCILREHEITENNYRWEIMGDPTEGSLVVVARKAHINKQEMERDNPRKAEIPFDSKNKFMITINAQGSTALINMKGAPEIVLSHCNQKLLQNKLETLREDEREKFQIQTDLYASKGFRVLGIARLKVNSADYSRLIQEFQQGKIKLVFLGLVGIIDPPRDEVKEAIRRAQEAGIKVFMATGDHKLTATAIGQEIGILSPGLQAMAGIELEKLSDSALDEAVKSNRVFARVSPEHKFRIVESLKRKKEIVAMTGDGANDAPALKTSDVGVAMGITGTDVTKDAASMILIDDNFASIVNAVEEGRVVNENIKKGIKFLLTTNMGEVITILLFLLLIGSHDLIFTPIMILWVNLVTDGTLTVAMASEPKEGDVMKRPPRDPNENLIDKSIIVNILITALLMAGGVLFIFNVYGVNASTIQKETLAFTALAVLQIFNAITSRSRRESIFKIGFRSNKAIMYGLIISFALQVLAVHLLFFNMILETTPLKLVDWLVIIGIGSIILIVDEIRKYILRHK